MCRIFLAVFFLFVCASLGAQRKILLLDSDTNKPIFGVSLKTDQGETVTSDKTGIATLTIPFDTIRFSHLKYSAEMLMKDEIRDTIYLVPTAHLLPEVTVSELPISVKQMINGWVRAAALAGAAEAPKGIASFDFANMLDIRGRRDKKHLKKAKEV